MAMFWAAVWMTMPTSVTAAPQKVVGRRPSRSVSTPDTIVPKKLPMKTEAVFRPTVAGVRAKYSV